MKKHVFAGICIAICGLTVATITSTSLASEQSAKPMLYPLVRYAKYEDGSNTSEYVGGKDEPYHANFKHLPVSEKPMKVDCLVVDEVGIVIKPIGTGSWIYGANRKYRFEWAHSSEPPGPIKKMQYRANTRYGFLRNRMKLRKWLVNGYLRLTISVSGEKVFETFYELSNCEANKFRTEEFPD